MSWGKASSVSLLLLLRLSSAGPPLILWTGPIICEHVTHMHVHFTTDIHSECDTVINKQLLLFFFCKRMQNLEPFSGWMRVVVLVVVVGMVMMMMMITNSRKQRKSSLSRWDESTASLIPEPHKPTVMALFKNHEAIASRCLFSIIQSIKKRRRTWRVWLQLEVCEIKYQKWYYLPIISSAVHVHMALWCCHQQKAVIGLYLPEPVPNIISFPNNAQKHFQMRASERACITTRSYRWYANVRG